MTALTLGLLGITCAILSLGHTCRLSHNDVIKGNAVGSIIYEGLAISLIFRAVLLLMGY